MSKKPTVTSTEEMSRPVLTVETPQVEPTTFTLANFLRVLKKVSRKQEQPPTTPSEEKPKE